MRVRIRKKRKTPDLRNALHIFVGCACLILLMVWTPAQDQGIFDNVINDNDNDHSHPIKWPKPISITSPAIYFIHVGKAGGMTLRVHLPVPLAKNKKELICWQRNESDVANCLAPSINNYSALSNHIRGHKHIGSSFFSPGEQEFLMSHTDTFLFSIRNPIERVVSAFYYHQNQKKKIKYPLFQCFDTMNELIGSLEEGDDDNNKNNNHNKNCSQLARRVLQGNTTRGGLHFAYNYEHYRDETIKKKPDHYVAVIRAEHLWQDTKDLDKMVGGTGVLEGDGKRYTHRHAATSSQEVATTTTSAGKVDEINSKGLLTLCCVLAREMATYAMLLSRAINLKPSQKQDSLRRVQNQCGIETSQASVDHLLESSFYCK